MRERDEIRAEGHADRDLDWADERQTKREDLLAGGGSAAELEERIDSIRKEMDATLLEFVRRLSPRHMLDEVRQGIREPAAIMRNLGRAVRANPVSVALVGIGLGWLVAKSRRSVSGSRRILSPGFRHGSSRAGLPQHADKTGGEKEKPSKGDLH